MWAISAPAPDTTVLLQRLRIGRAGETDPSVWRAEKRVSELERPEKRNDHKACSEAGRRSRLSFVTNRMAGSRQTQLSAPCILQGDAFA